MQVHHSDLKFLMNAEYVEETEPLAADVMVSLIAMPPMMIVEFAKDPTRVWDVTINPVTRWLTSVEFVVETTRK